MPDIDY